MINQVSRQAQGLDGGGGLDGTLRFKRDHSGGGIYGASYTNKHVNIHTKLTRLYFEELSQLPQTNVPDSVLVGVNE